MRVADVLKVLLSFQVPVQDALLGPFTTPCFKTVSRRVQEIEEFWMENANAMKVHTKSAVNAELALKDQHTIVPQKVARL